MRRHIDAINFITAAGAIILIVMSLWPGFANGYIACLALPVIALLGLGWLNVFVIWLLGAGEGRKALKITQLAFAPTQVCLTLVVLIFYVPRRIAFAVCRSEFDRVVASVPINDDDGVPFGKRLGIYYVDRYAAYPTGGTFFRTGSNSALIMDTFSYGFVYQPNLNSPYTPFGHTDYVVRPLGNGWYWFTVMNRF